MEDNSYILHIVYNFSSGLGIFDESDCITDYKAKIHAEHFSKKPEYEYVGEIEFKVIHLSKAEEEGFDVFELFDSSQNTYKYAQDFYDFENGMLASPLLEAFPDLEYMCNRICVIERIGIIPKYRKKGVGAKAFKNMVLHFGHCELFLLQPYPLQFESRDKVENLSDKLELEKMEMDEDTAMKSLSKHYQSWGFKEVAGIPELLFYSPIYRNDAFDNID